MKPEVQRVLRALDTTDTNGVSEDKGSLTAMLDRAGLSLEECLAGLADIALYGDTSNVKKAALDSALKMHGALKEQAPPPPVVTIVIQDPNNAGLDNPILFPRQILVPAANTSEKVQN